jgi:chromosome partitioning protein
MVIVVTGQKGGAGKSTLSICLAVEGMERGQRVLLVDADPQGTARTWGEVAAEQGRPVPTIVAMGATMHRPDQLPRVAEPFDLVIVDCPPRAGDVQRAALMVASVALLPCGPAAPDAWALASSLALVQEAQTLRPELPAAVVVTKRLPRTVVGQGAREVLSAGGLPVLAAECSNRVAYQEAIAAGQGVTTYAPSSDAAREVRALFDEVVGLVAPPVARSVRRAKPGLKATAASKGKVRRG